MKKTDKTDKNPSSTSSRKIRPALSPEAKEDQMISLAMDLVQQRLIDGTASSQETTHFLKLASAKARLERERLELENELTKAKTESIRAQKRSDELFAEAIKAFKTYSGSGNSSEEENYDEY